MNGTCMYRHDFFRSYLPTSSLYLAKKMNHLEVCALVDDWCIHFVLKWSFSVVLTFA